MYSKLTNTNVGCFSNGPLVFNIIFIVKTNEYHIMCDSKTKNLSIGSHINENQFKINFNLKIYLSLVSIESSIQFQIFGVGLRSNNFIF